MEKNDEKDCSVTRNKVVISASQKVAAHCCFVCRQGEKFLAQPTTYVKLGSSGRWLGTWTGAGVTATLV